MTSEQQTTEKTVDVEAAGRVLSTKNSDRLKAAFMSMSEVLVDAGVLSADWMPDEGDVDASTIIHGDPDEPSIQAASEAFAEQVKRVTWHDRFKSTLKIFAKRFLDYHNLTEEEWTNRYGTTAGDRASAVKQLIADFTKILTEMNSDHPGATNDWEARYEGMEAPYLYLSAEAGEPKPINRVSVSFESNHDVKISSKGRKNPNKHPISGVLFRVDEVSEAIPAVGPGLPLYIPSHVAESLSVAGLPLDADDTLSQHADEEPVGVMLTSETKDQDFVIHGLLWGASRPDKLGRIVANKENLGMSLTGDGWGHEAEIDGQKVFYMDDLELRGANILYSDLATYQKTRLLSAEKRDPQEEQSVAIAATKDPLFNTVEESMDTRELEQKLSAIADSLKGFDGISQSVTSLHDGFQSLNEKVANLSGTVIELQGKEQQRDAAIKAQQQQAEEQRKVEETQSTIATLVQQSIEASLGDHVQQAIAKVINPSGQPARKTKVVASGNDESVDDIRLQLASKEGELNALKASGNFVNRTQMLKLTEEIHQLKSQLV